MLNFEKSRKNRIAGALTSIDQQAVTDIPVHLLRQDVAVLPELSELQVVRHYTRLSRKNFSIDTQFLSIRFLHDEI